MALLGMEGLSPGSADCSLAMVRGKLEACSSGKGCRGPSAPVAVDSPDKVPVMDQRSKVEKSQPCSTS